MRPHPFSDGSPARRRWAIVCLLGVLVLAVLTWRVAATGSVPGDAASLRLARTLHSSWLERAMRGVSDIGAVVVGAALLGACWIALRRGPAARRQAIELIGAVVLALALKWIIKDLVWRPADGLRGSPDQYPSGHATATLALACELVTVSWARPRRRWMLVAATAFVLAVGVARVLMEVHFASDVIAGWALALATVGALRVLAARET
jgi:undecaprenyl-diphosphatase